jgi:hypothetical protein
MSVSTEVLKQDLDRLTHHQLEQVSDFIAFLKFRDRRHPQVVLDSPEEQLSRQTNMAALFAEFADEDLALAEAGIVDYAVMLQQEDRA